MVLIDLFPLHETVSSYEFRLIHINDQDVFFRARLWSELPKDQQEVCMGFAWSLNGFITALYHANSVHTPYILRTYCVHTPGRLHTNRFDWLKLFQGVTTIQKLPGKGVFKSLKYIVVAVI